MNKSQSIAALSTAMAKAQAEMHNPRFDSTNPHFRSKFASLAAVRECVIPILAKHGISLTQFPVSQEGRAGCINHLSHESGEWMEESFTIPVDKQNAHGFASALTYAKRLSMQSIAGVVGDEDDDGNGSVSAGVGDKMVADFVAAMEGETTKEGVLAQWQKAAAACKAANDAGSHAVLKKIAERLLAKFKDAS